MAAACVAPPPGHLAPAVLAELVAPLANMAQAALGAGPGAGGDPRRAEGEPLPPRARGDRIPVTWTTGRCRRSEAWPTEKAGCPG